MAILGKFEISCRFLPWLRFAEVSEAIAKEVRLAPEDEKRSRRDMSFWAQLGEQAYAAAKLDKVHFQEQVHEDKTGTSSMTFDYRLRPGVVRSTNALRLMRLVGIDVDLE